MAVTPVVSTWKEACWLPIVAIIDSEGPGTQEQIEYAELASAYGENPDAAVWRDLAAAYFTSVPAVPSETMLLDLALLKYWTADPYETREAYVQAYQWLLAKLPIGPDGAYLAPVEPTEQMLLAIAGVDKVDASGEEGVCLELEAAYEGYKLMLDNYKPISRLAS